MTFATIEEVWGPNFNLNSRIAGPVQQVIEAAKNIPKVVESVPFGYGPYDILGGQLNYPNSSALPAPSGPVQHSPDMSRTYNRAPMTTGPETRLPQQNNYSVPQQNNYSVPQQNNYREKFDSNQSTSPNIEEQESKDDIIQRLKNENKKLKKMIEDLKNKSQNGMGDNAFDLIMFLVSAVVIIFMMDSFAKMIRRF
jgi:hypothetical protein